ncbi:MAG: hypothetical protein AAGE18_13460 [Pseudomonadota bacterium]
MLRASVFLVAIIAMAVPASSGTVFNQFQDASLRTTGRAPLGGSVPLVTAGPIFDGMSAGELGAMLALPGSFQETRFVPAEQMNRIDGIRVVLAFGQSSPSGLCDDAPSGGGANGVVSAAFCLGGRELSRATLRRGRNLERDMRQLMDVLFRPRGGNPRL